MGSVGIEQYIEAMGPREGDKHITRGSALEGQDLPVQSLLKGEMPYLLCKSPG